MQREAHDELADADLDLSKAEQRCGRPATAARVHVAPARNLDLDYDLAGRDVLGEGASGKVLKGKCRNTGVLVAVKSLEIPPLDRQEVQDCVGEAQIFLALDHPHVVRLVDVYISQHRVDLVMELMGGGDLFDLLSRRGALPETEAVDATTQILEALTYLHSSNVAHCDMKLENCLFASSRCQHLKLADFGFSQCFKDKAELKRWAGTYGYMSPELLQGDYTESCDMWAVGVIVVALLTDAMPFPPKDEDLEAKIAAVQWDESRARVAALSKEALAFVEGLLIPHVDGRLSASQALQHPWIARHARKSGADAIDESIVASLRAYKEASHFRQACWSVMAWALSHDERETVREAFLAFDLGRTGTVLLREMRSVLTERGLSPREAEDIFRALDLEGNNRVGYSDFLASMCAAKIPLEERHVQEVFRRFDYDNTGRVTERCLHHLFQTPMDDVHVNRYFAEVVGTEGLHLSQLEAVLRRGGEIEKSASVQQMRPSPGPEELDRDESCRI